MKFKVKFFIFPLFITQSNRKLYHSHSSVEFDKNIFVNKIKIFNLTEINRTVIATEDIKVNK